MNVLILIFTLFFCTPIFAQEKHLEISLKPIDVLYKDFTLYTGFGNDNYRVGVITGFRPSTQKDGEVINNIVGLGGSYHNSRHFNDLYNAYTIGFYFKRLLFNSPIFFESNYFYRHWYFHDKQASFDNVEGYRFNATRTESTKVHCIKLLLGKTFVRQTDKKLKPYIDIYAGVGLRTIRMNYQTYNGTVNDINHNYLEENISQNWITPHLSIKIGLTK